MEMNELYDIYSGFTFLAEGPFSPSPMVNSTFWPSESVLNPSDSISLKWTNKSSLPSQTNPFFSSNHLTVPSFVSDISPLVIN